jgi:hypothetical protein
MVLNLLHRSGALPTLTKSFLTPKSHRLMEGRSTVIYDVSALASKTLHPQSTDATAVIGCRGDCDSLSVELQQLRDRQLEVDRERMLINRQVRCPRCPYWLLLLTMCLRVSLQIGQERAEIARLSTETSTLRLGMFTRRIAHRYELVGSPLCFLG